MDESFRSESPELWSYSTIERLVTVWSVISGILNIEKKPESFLGFLNKARVYL